MSTTGACVTLYVGCIPLCPLLSQSLDGTADSTAADAVSPARAAIANIVHKLINYCTDSSS